MNNTGLLKIIGLLVVALLLVGGALALTNKSNPAVLSGDALKAALGSAQSASAAQTGSKDWSAILAGVKGNALTGAGSSTSASSKRLSDSEMKTIIDVLGKRGSSNQQTASASFSKDSSGSLSKGAEMAGKAFEQMGQNK